MPGTLSKLVDANLVVPGLFIGSMPSPGRYRWLGALVLCAKEYQPDPTHFPGLTILRVPLDDDPVRGVTPREARNAMTMARTVARYVAASQPVLTTCVMGWNRSSLVAGLAMHALYKMPADEIIARVRHARGKNALSNPSLVKLLKRVAG
jgi:protein-tyrosine phosphatase